MAGGREAALADPFHRRQPAAVARRDHAVALAQRLDRHFAARCQDAGAGAEAEHLFGAEGDAAGRGQVEGERDGRLPLAPRSLQLELDCLEVAGEIGAGIGDAERARLEVAVGGVDQGIVVGLVGQRDRQGVGRGVVQVAEAEIREGNRVVACVIRGDGRTQAIQCDRHPLRPLPMRARSGPRKAQRAVNAGGVSAPLRARQRGVTTALPGGNSASGRCR